MERKALENVKAYIKPSTRWIKAGLVGCVVLFVFLFCMAHYVGKAPHPPLPAAVPLGLRALQNTPGAAGMKRLFLWLMRALACLPLPALRAFGAAIGLLGTELTYYLKKKYIKSKILDVSFTGQTFSLYVAL